MMKGSRLSRDGVATLGTVEGGQLDTGGCCRLLGASVCAPGSTQSPVAAVIWQQKEKKINRCSVPPSETRLLFPFG